MKSGDTVRLVVATDVRLGGRVVISRGSVARARVTAVWKPDPAHQTTGLQLQLDWAEAVTGREVPLRAVRKGKAKPFQVEVLSTGSGHTVRPATFGRDILRALALSVPDLTRLRMYVPVGARMTGFVEGDARLPLVEVERAQSSLPAPDPHAMVYVYRTRGHQEQRPRIYCRDTKVGQVGERQYLTLSLAPGLHRLRAEQGKNLVIRVEAGQEYFVRLHSRKLTAVDYGEGEDAVAELEPVPEQDRVSGGETCIPD